jgi:CHAT domain-containing protein
VSYISSADKLDKNLNSFLAVSNQLYQLLFQNSGLPAGRILVSPDGRYFPFEALVTSTQPLTYFLEDHAVSYTYSARYLLNNFAINSSTDSYKFAGIAPVQYMNGLPALPGSDQSLERIKNYFHSAANFVGSKASKDNFLKEYYKYSIVQLYTHATDSGYTGEPMIYFSDSVLSLSDFYYEAKPSTSLIVLSACETAGGRLYNGEGVFSFNRQFAALGIPSAIANLWSVDNESTYKLTELFYKYLAKGLTSDVALQKAKLEFIKKSSKESSLPYYWAGPILAGKADKIELNKPLPWNWIIAVIALGVFSFLLWKKRK